MRNRQRRSINLDVAPEQRAILERISGALPHAVSTDAAPAPGELAALFYHPNSAARVLALTLSAGYDVAAGRSDGADKKLDRALQVFTLVSDDASGRRHLEELRGRLTDAASFLEQAHAATIPFLYRSIDGIATPMAAPAAPAMPRAVEDGTLPEEKRSVRSGAARPARTPRSRRGEERTSDDGVEAPVEETVVSTPVEETIEAPAPTRAAPTDSSISDDEAAAAAAAALAAIEAPYEDVVEDDAKPRFDPDRDLDPENGRRNRRRRARGPEGLERPRPDQVKPEPGEAREVQDDDAPAPAPRAEREPREALKLSFSRHAGLAEVPEQALEIVRLALRAIRERSGELGQRVKLELLVTPAEPRPEGGRGPGANAGGDRGGDRGGDKGAEANAEGDRRRRRRRRGRRNED